jgi:hypothetical protein
MGKMADHWMQNASKRMKEKGTEGSFTRIAEEHGRTVHQEALADENAPGKVGKKARMALVFEEAAAKRKNR